MVYLFCSVSKISLAR